MKKSIVQSAVGLFLVALAVGAFALLTAGSSTQIKQNDLNTVVSKQDTQLQQKFELVQEQQLNATGLNRFGEPDLAAAAYVTDRAPVGTNEIDHAWYDAARVQMADMLRYSSVTQDVMPSENARSAAEQLESAALAWDEIGPGNIGGRSRGFVIDPNTPATMYIGGVAGGVWKTTNSGGSWSALNDSMANLAIASLAMDPSNSSVLYAGTGEGFFNGDAVRGDGIFKTSDAGSTWTQLAATAGDSDFHYVSEIVISPNDSNRVYAATRTGVWRSTNGGATWGRVLSHSGSNSRCLDLDIRTDTGSADTLLASCGTFSIPATVYRSTNNGDNWSAVLGETNMGRTTVSIAPSNQNIMYALAASTDSSSSYNNGLHAVYRSTDGGATWSARVRNTDGNRLNTVQLTNPVFAFLADCGFGGANQFFNQGWYDNIIAVDPTDPNIVWSGGIDIMKSTDGGQSWGLTSQWWANISASDYAHADNHNLVFHPDYNGSSNQQLFAINDGGIQRTSNAKTGVADTTSDAACNVQDSTIAWTRLNNSYGVTQFYHGVPYPDNSAVFGGTQDNGTLRDLAASSNINDWSEIFGGDGGYVAIDPGNTNVLFAETTRLSIRKSTDGGASFATATTGISESSNNFRFINPFIMDPNNAQNLWTGGMTLWRTTNQAGSWTQASVTNMSTTGSFSAYAIATGNSNRVLAATEGGQIFLNDAALSASSGSSWSSAQPTSGVISWLAFDPQNSNVAYATVSTFGVDHVLKSTDAGSSWSAIDNRGGTNGIPDIPAHSVVVNPDDSNTIYVGTDLGVFVTTDGGSTWMVENSGLANTPVETLTFNGTGANEYLYAFTHGRGAFRVKTGTTPPLTEKSYIPMVQR